MVSPYRCSQRQLLKRASERLRASLRIAPVGSTPYEYIRVCYCFCGPFKRISLNFMVFVAHYRLPLMYIPPIFQNCKIKSLRMLINCFIILCFVNQRSRLLSYHDTYKINKFLSKMKQRFLRNTSFLRTRNE